MSAQAEEVEVQFAALGLAAPEVSVPNLRNVMTRIGCAAAPEEFLQWMSAGYRYALDALRISDARFETSNSHAVLSAGLAEACDRLPAKARILVLGCSDDFVGCNAEYAARTVLDVIAPAKISVLRSWNFARSDLYSRSFPSTLEEFDLVVTNSFLHFVPELGATVRCICSSLARNGMYLMAHEPNARFLSNSVLRGERRQMSIETTPTWRQRAFRWSAYQTKLKTWLGGSPPPDIAHVVSEYLAARHGVRGALTGSEISGTVDPHRPSETTGGFRIGLNGFDETSLSDLWPKTARVVWSRSYDHLGYIEYADLPKKWQQANIKLAKDYPLDGSSWTALWRLQ